MALRRARERWQSALLMATATLALATGLAACGDGGDDVDRAAEAEPSGPQVTTPEGFLYLSLGDSLARGVQPDPALSGRRGYPRKLGRLLEKRAGERLTLIEAGCPGATTDGFIKGDETCPPQAPIPYENNGASTSQLAFAEAQLRARRDLPTFVTLSIGGNDVLACIDVDPASVRSCLASNAEGFKSRLEEIATRLKAAAGPKTVLEVATFYDPALGALALGRAPLELVTAFHDAITQGINPAIRSTFSGAPWVVADLAAEFDEDLPVTGVDSTPVKQICRYTWACSPEADIHLNNRGYALSARVHLRAASRALGEIYPPLAAPAG